jgi:hypothetical protein
MYVGDIFKKTYMGWNRDKIEHVLLAMTEPIGWKGCFGNKEALFYVFFYGIRVFFV